MSTAVHIEPSPAGELTIVAAADQHAHWLQWLADTAAAVPAAGGPAEVALDLSAVEAFDSAGVQLLLALQHSLAARGQALQLQQPSTPVCEALDRFGLRDQLPCVAGEAA